MGNDRVLRYYPSALKAALLVVGAAAFVAAGFLMLAASSKNGDLTHLLLAYVDIGFFGLCGLVGLWLCLSRLIGRKPLLVVESRGIRWLAGTRLRGTPWEDIRDIAMYRQRLPRGGSQYYLVMGARGPHAAYKGTLGRLSASIYPSLGRAAGWVPLNMLFVFCTHAKRQAILQRIHAEFAPELAHYRIFVDEQERDL